MNKRLINNKKQNSFNNKDKNNKYIRKVNNKIMYIEELIDFIEEILNKYNNYNNSKNYNFTIYRDNIFNEYFINERITIYNMNEEAFYIYFENGIMKISTDYYFNNRCWEFCNIDQIDKIIKYCNDILEFIKFFIKNKDKIESIAEENNLI